MLTRVMAGIVALGLVPAGEGVSTAAAAETVRAAQVVAGHAGPALEAQPVDQIAAPVTLAPRFAEGDRLEYAFEFQSTVGRVESGAVEGVVQRGTLRLNVLGVDERGAAAMTMVFSTLQIEPDAAPDEAEAAAELAEEIAGAMRDVVVRLDVQPDGTISALTGLEPVHEVVGRHGRRAWPLLGPFASEYAADALSELFRVDAPAAQAFPEREVGETWAIASERPLAESTVLRTRAVWSLESVVDDAASLRAEIERSMGSTESGSPAAATLSIADQSGTLTARWSVADGRLLERTMQSQLDVRAAVGDLQGPIVRASTSLHLRLLKPGESEQAAADPAGGVGSSAVR